LLQTADKKGSEVKHAHFFGTENALPVAYMFTLQERF